MASNTKSKPKIYYWSPTGLEAFERCERQWLFNQDYNLTSGDFALGTFVHRKINSLRVSPKYKSAEKWASACIGDWKHRIIKKGKIEGKNIAWKTIKQSEDEKWILIPRLEQICIDNFDQLMNENSKTVFFPAKNRYGKTTTYRTKSFVFEGIGFAGEIDEIRRGDDFPIVIRDYKTGFRDYLERRLAYKYQPTFYALFVCYQAFVDPQFRALLGIDDELAKTWCGNPYYIDPRIKIEYYMLEKQKLRNSDGSYQLDDEENYLYDNKAPIMTTTRSNSDYFELWQKIIKANRQRRAAEEEKDYEANRDIHCERCPFTQQCNQMSTDLPYQTKQKRFLPIEYTVIGVYGGPRQKNNFVFATQQFKDKPEEIYKQLTLDFPRQRRKIKTET